MEQTISNTTNNVTDNNINNDDAIIVANDDNKDKVTTMTIKDHHQGPPTPMKKRGHVNFFRAAFYMLRSGKSMKTSKHVDMASKVLGSMRPLHLQTNSDNDDDDSNNYNYNNNNQLKDIKAPMPPPMIEEVFTPPASPAVSSSIPSSSSMDSLSQYASAMNLQELDNCQDEDYNGYDDNGGDFMIETKAEEFINQFYEQMRLQNIEYMNSLDERN